MRSSPLVVARHVDSTDRTMAVAAQQEALHMKRAMRGDRGQIAFTRSGSLHPLRAGACVH
jgi:hypothetical protein